MSSTVDEHSRNYDSRFDDDRLDRWKGYSRKMFRYIIVAYFVIGISAILSSSLTLYVLSKVKNTSQSQNLLLKTLGLIDLSIGFVTVSGALNESIQLFRPDIVCKICALHLTICSSMTTEVLLLIALDKLLSILRPLRYHCFVTLFRIRVLLVVALANAVFWMIFVVSSDTFLDQLLYDSDSGFCFPSLINPRRKLASCFYVVVWICLPFSLILTSYLWIGLIARQQNKRINDVSVMPCGHQQRSKEWKGIKIALCLTTAFILVWVPTLSITLLQSVGDYTIPPPVKFFSGFLTLSNSCCNLVFHFVCYKEFTFQAKQVFGRIMKMLTCKDST